MLFKLFKHKINMAQFKPQIDRASAGNCKLNNQEKSRDKETPDEFGYTMGEFATILLFNTIKITYFSFKPKSTNVTTLAEMCAKWKSQECQINPWV